MHSDENWKIYTFFFSNYAEGLSWQFIANVRRFNSPSKPPRLLAGLRPHFNLFNIFSYLFVERTILAKRSLSTFTEQLRPGCSTRLMATLVGVRASLRPSRLYNVPKKWSCSVFFRFSGVLGELCCEMATLCSFFRSAMT